MGTEEIDEVVEVVHVFVLFGDNGDPAGAILLDMPRRNLHIARYSHGSKS